jgi:hypothetical protein
MGSRGSLIALAAVGFVLGCNGSRGGGSSPSSTTAPPSTTAPVTSTPVSTPPTAPPPPSTPPLTPPGPPPQGTTVQAALTWDFARQVVFMNVGDRAVCPFTTGAQAPKSGEVDCAEYNSPPQMRHGFLATDAAGVNVVPNSVAYGTAVVIFLGPGNAELKPNTTYYFIFDFQLPSGLSGPLGGPGETIVGIDNVSY